MAVSFAVFRKLGLMKIINALPTHFGDVTITPVGPNDAARFGDPIKISTTYINNLYVPVTIAQRSGLKFTLPQTGDLRDNRLIMRTQYDINSEPILNDFKRLLNTVGEHDVGELKVLRQLITLKLYGDGKQNKGKNYPHAALILDYPITQDQLLNYGGSIYYQEMDDVVSLLPWEDAPAHPYSVQGKNTRLIETTGNGHTPLGFGYSVELVDNRGRFGVRYLNIGHEVHLVPTCCDYERRDGVYVITNRAVEGETGIPLREVKHYPFEGAEQLGLFRTFEEALHSGDTSLARKQEIASLEHEIVMQKQALQKAKNEHELTLLEREKEAKILEMEREVHARKLEEMRLESEHKLRMERERTKAFYEDRSYDRKDSNEMLKFLPTVMVGIGSILMAVKAFSGK